MGETESILGRLEDERVFGITETAEGFQVYEECDRYFSVTLTRAELLQLAEEIKRIATPPGDG